MIPFERALLRWRGMQPSSFASSTASLACGLVQSATSVFVRALALGAYAWVYAHMALVHLELTLPTWIAIAVLVDHQYYWWHRASHRVGIFWASHAVHHQSESYDLATALRQSALQGLLASPVYWPLALLGVPPTAFVAAWAGVSLYQFWLHTRLIGRLPAAIEWAFNTPSHHRVHHGIDREYVDRNYGGVLIVWDRLFGTFCAERHEPRYGTLAPFDSASVASANLVEWSRMLNVARETRRLRDKLWVFVAPPEWRPSDVRVATASRARPRDVPADVALVVSLQIVIVAIAAGLALAPELGVRAGLLVEDPSGVALAVLVAWLSLVAIGWGALLDRRAWSPALALALAALTPVIAFVAGASAPMLAAACVAGAASALAVHRVAASRVERHSIATRRASA